MAYVYILQSARDGRYYIGSTINPDQRYRHHLGGHTPSTKRMGPIKLVFQQEYPTLKEARAVEKKLKSFKRMDFIEKIIKDGYIKN